MKPSRPRLYKVSEQMKAWSAALQAEIATWPKVTIRPMFGLFGVYRGSKIFAALPRTRTMERPNSVAFKIPATNSRLRLRAKRDPRIRFPERQNSKWLSFEITSDGDLRATLEWLGRAYEAAR